MTDKQAYLLLLNHFIGYFTMGAVVTIGVTVFCLLRSHDRRLKEIIRQSRMWPFGRNSRQ